MRQLGLRVFRIIAFAIVAYVAVAWSSARGVAWIGWTITVSLFSAFLGLSLFDARKRSRSRTEARWERAMYEPGKRSRATSELRRAIRRLEPVKQSGRAEHARLSVMLAELLDADGEHEDAMAAVDGLSITALPQLDAGLVRHTRAVTHLRAADAQGALVALTGRAPSGDVELDQRLSLLEAYARIELGEVQDGLAQAERIAHTAGADQTVVTEARVVRAAGLDALGRREEALVVLAALGRDSLTQLAELGHPRVRRLAKVALESAVA